MAIPGYIIDKIRQSSNIIEVISEYINLKKMGRNFKSLCPFHQEKTPSFIVSPDKQIYHCFGCGEGGNVFNFVMKMENISFSEAALKLAKRANIKVPKNIFSKEYNGKYNKEKERIFKINMFAADFYHNYLLSSSEASFARRYLEQRGITKDIIELFKIGYVGKSGYCLSPIAIKNGFLKQDLIKANLVKSNNKELFTNRIIFPIFDIRNRVIAFGARLIDEKEGLPKYINSPESVVFSKGRNLYGFNITKESIKENPYLIIVEGYFDLITCVQYGFRNCVATLGTALTAEQANLILRYTKNVVIVYDGDPAGFKAALRGWEVLIEQGLQVKVVILPKGYDPDKYLRTQNKEGFSSLISSASPLIDFWIKISQQHLDLKINENKIKVIEELIPIISKIKDPFIKETELKKLSYYLEIKEDHLYWRLQQEKRIRKPVSSPGLQQRISSSGIINLQEKIIQSMLKDTSKIKKIKSQISVEDFPDKNYRQIISLIYSLTEAQNEIDPNVIMDRLNNNNEDSNFGVNQIMSKLIMEIEEDKVYFEDRTIDKMIFSLKRFNDEQKYKQLEKEINLSLQRNLPISSEKIRLYHQLSKQLKGSRR